jgi:integrase
VKPDVVIVGAKEVKYETGHYALRFYQGSRLIFEAVKGATAAGAEAARFKKEAQFTAIVRAEKEGIQVVKPDPQRQTLAVLFRRFISETMARGSTEAAEVYELACNEFLKVIGVRYPDEVLPEHIATFHKHLFERGMSIRTVNNRHASVKAFLKSFGYDPKVMPKPPRFDKTLPEIYSDKELDGLFEGVSSPRENLLYILLMQSGLREREAEFLEWDDVDHRRRVLKLRSKSAKWGFRLKDFEEREIPLPDDLLTRLTAWKALQVGDCSLVFARDGKPDGHMLRTLKKQARAAGVNCGECNGCKGKMKECERFYLHKFRATYCTKLLRSGMDMRSVQALMGHSDLESTMRYVRPADGEEIQSRINGIIWTTKIRGGAALAVGR